MNSNSNKLEPLYIDVDIIKDKGKAKSLLINAYYSFDCTVLQNSILRLKASSKQ